MLSLSFPFLGIVYPPPRAQNKNRKGFTCLFSFPFFPASGTLEIDRRE
ncbi:hypothetical protein NC653_039129 [Populus alba x Populus x berolinensis]|uniref:Uncharacterized protein n=1 Tax=Populus alba x Populus x berolinensis TaxID=444605 RepID=A0AAD6PQ01_9ROSI|nr:hypothetical protein NC653_038875 [Populus alba x Populus x berolinensis]KAJ6957071.1 hypothetical protein NC653_039101 [Populus alba x Populus x berolinensis]KAJ6957107.1 hypothetical protein NC653_039129 [Populus alba x Populus x berolinensis]